MRTQLGDVTSHAGGVIIGIHRRFEAHGLQVHRDIVVPGCAIYAAVSRDGRYLLHLLNVRIDPSLEVFRQLDVFRRVAAAGHLGALNIFGGDWNIIQRDEERDRNDCTARRDLLLVVTLICNLLPRRVSATHHTFHWRGFGGMRHLQPQRIAGMCAT